jgi:hypothetical protein
MFPESFRVAIILIVFTQIAAKQNAAHDVIVKVFDRAHKILLLLESDRKDGAVHESKRQLSRILPQILIILSCTTKLLKDHSLRLKFTSIARLSQSVSVDSELLQPAFEELQWLVRRVVEMQRIPGRWSINVTFILS